MIHNVVTGSQASCLSPVIKSFSKAKTYFTVPAQMINFSPSLKDKTRAKSVRNLHLAINFPSARKTSLLFFVPPLANKFVTSFYFITISGWSRDASNFQAIDKS